MGFFSGGQTTSTSDSYSGLRGTKYLRPVASELPGGFQFGMNYAKTALGDTNPFQLQENGLTAPQMSAFKTLSDQLFSNNSARYASRGILSPESAGAISGDALTQMTPQLMAQVFQNQVASEQAKSDRFSRLKALLDSGTGLLGQENHSTSTTKGPNLLGGAIAQGIGSWTDLNSYANLARSLTGGGGGGGNAKAIF